MSVKILMVLLIPNVEDLTNYEWAKNSANEPQWNTAIERGESPVRNHFSAYVTMLINSKDHFEHLF